jgi:hypothetical protein
MKAFRKQCPAVVVTNRHEKADYIVRLRSRKPQSHPVVREGNKVAVFDKSDDLVYSDSARYLSAAVYLFALALPFVAGLSNILGLFIIFLGVFEAWKLNRVPELRIAGPFDVPASPIT